MGYYIGNSGEYYEGDRITSADTPVPQRPDELHKWDGTAWVLDPAAQRSALVQQAQTELDKTDMVALRCWKAGVTYPTSWQTYTTALRAIVNGTDTTSTMLPTQPVYPTGT